MYGHESVKLFGSVSRTVDRIRPAGLAQHMYRVLKKRNLGISQEIDIVLRTKGFRCLGI
jgi:hypothetical protein